MLQRKKCLALCARPISSNAAQAGDKCAYHFIRDLAEEYDLELILIVNASDKVEDTLGVELGVSALQVYRIGRWHKYLLILRGLLLGIPPRYGSRFKTTILADLHTKISSGKYSHIYYEFSQCAPYHLELNEKVNSTLSVHDVQMQVVLRAKPFEGFLFSWLTYRFEGRLFKAIDNVVVLCDKDKKLIEGLYQHPNISIRPPPLSEFVRHVVREPAHIETYSMLFWGALARSENEEAAWFLVDQVFPLVMARYPSVKLYIVGSRPSKRLLEAKSDAIIVTGFVDDPTPFFTRAHIGVLPLKRGAGIKLKTLEMLACKIPVITTDIGAEGVFNDGSLTIVDLDEITNAVIDMFSN